MQVHAELTKFRDQGHHHKPTQNPGFLEKPGFWATAKKYSNPVGDRGIHHPKLIALKLIALR
jgi:hypothetical protein